MTDTCPPTARPRRRGAEALAGLARLAEELTGIVLAPDRSAMLEARLGRRLRALGLPDLPAYLGHLAAPEGRAERAEFISAITTNDSAFFREPHHFALLRATVLPPLLARARAGGRVRLWSAGTALGQEAYSLAMLVLDLLPEAERLDIRILATDIDERALAAAREGRFAPATAAALPAEYAGRFLDRGPDWVTPTPEVRALVRLRRLDLHADWPMKRLFDVIMCRNVAIYFGDRTRVRLWRRLAAALKTDGHLFIGHSERIEPGPALPLVTAGPTCLRRTAGQDRQGGAEHP